MGPGVLDELLSDLPRLEDSHLLVGFDASDDAAVYRIDEKTAMIQTVDFFPPMVDDPFIFGQIAAANALSDVYAMGGRPVLAMNLLCFPSCLPLDVVKEVLAGGYDKVREAGAVIAGGHSIDDKELKYGLCVSGLAAPDKILTNSGAHPGDVLVLTKMLGSGILITGAKAGLLSAAETHIATDMMRTLNKTACEEMLPLAPSACTDVTGFGLLGHAREMAHGSGLTLELEASRVPVSERALALARDGIIPGGAYRNMDFLEHAVSVVDKVPQDRLDALYAPQTAGGLLIALPPEKGQQLVRSLQKAGLTDAAVVGQFVPADGKDIRIRF